MANISVFICAANLVMQTVKTAVERCNKQQNKREQDSLWPEGNPVLKMGLSTIYCMLLFGQNH